MGNIIYKEDMVAYNLRYRQMLFDDINKGLFEQKNPIKIIIHNINVIETLDILNDILKNDFEITKYNIEVKTLNIYQNGNNEILFLINL